MAISKDSNKPVATDGPYVADTGTVGGRSLNYDQHAGSGPSLTGSGVGPKGVVTPVAGINNLSGGFGMGNTAEDGALVIEKTFDKVIRWRNRLEPMYRNFAGVSLVRDAAFPGSKVTLFRTGAAGLALATTPLSEYADPDAVPLPGLEDKMDVSVDEYGNSTVVTNRLKRFSWQDISPMQIEYVRRNMADTTDAIFANALFSTSGGWNKGGVRQAVAGAAGVIGLTGAGFMTDDKLYPATGRHGLIGTGLTGAADTTALGGAAVAAAPGSILTPAHIRKIVAHFRSLGVLPFGDGTYKATITPDVSISLRESTDLAGWRYPHLEENANGNIWRGTVGVFEGVTFIEGGQFRGMNKGETVGNVNSMINIAPAKQGGKEWDNILFFGPEGIGEVVVEESHAVVTPTNDKFGRLFGLGWIGCFGATVYDNNAILAVAALNGK